jgi:hypothetical protein
MNSEQIIQKVDNLEKQLLAWGKWLFVCYGAASMMFINALIRLVERSYLMQSFVFTPEELEKVGAQSGIIPDSVSQSINFSLMSPWWTLTCGFLLLAMMYPGIMLVIHSGWRTVSLTKRLNLIFGYFIASWIVLLSLGAQDPKNISGGYNLLLFGSAIAIGVGYWRLHKKQFRAEEVFP